MRPNYYAGLAIILFFFSSCSNFNNIFKDEKKVDISEKNSKLEKICPDYYIPEETKYLFNNTKEKVLKISGVKLTCKIVKTTKDKKNNKIIINQTIYYQILKKKIQLSKNNNFVYIAFVDEKNNNINGKILSKINLGSYKEVKGNIYFKNNNTFQINNNKKNKNLTFYYGFQK